MVKLTASTASRVIADGNIVEDFRVLVDGRVEETDRTAAVLETLLVKNGNNTSKERSRGRSATNTVNSAVDNSGKGVSKGSDIRETTTRGVEDVVAVGRGVVLEVVGDGGLLVVGGDEDVGEATARTEAVDGALTVLDVVGQEGGGTNGGDVGAVGGEGGGEALAVGVDELVLDVEAAIRVAGVVAVGYAAVPRGKEDGDSLESEFGPFLALAFLIKAGQGSLDLSV